MREFLSHCALIPAVASQYKTDSAAAADKAAAEESKEQSDDGAKSVAAMTSAFESSTHELAAASLQYDTLRAELRAHADKIGSRQSLAQFFERYLR